MAAERVHLARKPLGRTLGGEPGPHPPASPIQLIPNQTKPTYVEGLYRGVLYRGAFVFIFYIKKPRS